MKNNLWSKCENKNINSYCFTLAVTEVDSYNFSNYVFFNIYLKKKKKKNYDSVIDFPLIVLLLTNKEFLKHKSSNHECGLVLSFF